jgi:DNA-binding NarL/FixJ family response regulator
MVKIVIADDHVVLRKGLKSLLCAVEDWDVVAEASDGFEVLPLIEEHSPDLVILDLTMPNLGGLETIVRLQKLKDTPRILVLSAKEDDISVADAIRAGAKGYLPKSSEHEELTFAIKALLKGHSYISPSVANGLLNRDPHSTEDNSSPLSALSAREREVMKLLSEGKPNREVAKFLHISPRTIDSHRSNIMKKLDISSNAELVQYAVKYGLIE